MIISGEPGIEMGDLPDGGEEDVVSVVISKESGPEVGKAPPPPPAGAKKDVAPMVSAASQTRGGGGPPPPSPPLGGGGQESAIFMTISEKPSPEVGDPPAHPPGGEDSVVSVAISGKPGPEVDEPPPSWPPPFASSAARSGSLSSPLPRGGVYSSE